MKNDVFISYIIPCYNIQKYLPRCLDSLSKQKIESDADLEFVFVNDGSPDNCLGILSEFALQDSRAVIVDQKNQGVSAARNAGLKVAKGQYVFFLDGDDYLTDDASQLLYHIAQKSSPDIIITNAYIVEELSGSITEWNVCNNLAEGDYSVATFVGNVDFLPISFKAYKRESLLKNEIVYDLDLRVGEVYAFFLNAMSKSQCITVSKKRVINYLMRANSVMRDGNIERDKSILKTISKIDHYANNFSFNIRMTYSYNVAFLKIVNVFTQNKYIRQSKYTKEIGDMLSTIAKDDVYKNVLEFFVIRRPKFNKYTLFCIGMYVLNIRCFYTILRFIYGYKK